LPGDHRGLYEYSAGSLVFLGYGFLGGSEKTLFEEESSARDAVSTDGSRVIITGEYEGQRGLLLREPGSGQTLRIAGPKAVYQTASSDDSRVFYVESGGLYECQVIEGEDGLQCGASGTPTQIAPSGVLAPIPGVSEDGSYVYFFSTAVLTGGEADQHGQTAQTGQANLYVHQAGQTRLVAVLSRADDRDIAGPGKAAEPGKGLLELTSRVSPDGRWLAFESERSLTGYDNHDARTGKPDGEVFLYHAAAGGEPGTLICASCNPTEGRPVGASSVPGYSTERYQSRYLSDGGRLFFDSSDALLAQDTDHTQDVYEYEPPGEGEESPPNDSCTTSLSTYSPASRGCVDLISNGQSSEPSSFLDASEDGDDVFFLTTSQLSKQDTDTAYDVYDASTQGPEPQPAKPVECQGDTCAATSPPPETITPGSLTFQGPGNLTPELAPVTVKPKTAAQLRAEKRANALKACKKDKKKKKRQACERAARAKYAVHASKASKRKR
jgi:WD40-like Beta Propeller Repeat